MKFTLVFVICAMMLTIGYASAADDIFNIQLDTPRDQPQVTTLRVKSMIVDFKDKSIVLRYAYGSGVDDAFIESTGAGDVSFQGSEVTDIMVSITDNIAPLLKVILSNKLTVPVK